MKANFLLTLFCLLLCCLFQSCNKSQEKYEFDGQNGVRVFYHKGSNIIRSKTEYKDGKINGKYSNYFPDGKIQTEVVMVNNKKQGSFKTFYANGALKSIEFYKDNDKDSLSLYYDVNGKLEKECFYKHGNLHGPFKSYYPNGKIFQEFNFQYGAKNGVQKVYFEDGKLKLESEFDEGRVIASAKEFKEDGTQIKREAHIVVEEINKVEFENTYILRVRFEKPTPYDKFYTGELKEGKLHYGLNSILKENGVFEIKFVVPKGFSLMEEVKIVGVTRSKPGKDIVATHKVNLAVDNY